MLKDKIVDLIKYLYSENVQRKFIQMRLFTTVHVTFSLYQEHRILINNQLRTRNNQLVCNFAYGQISCYDSTIGGRMIGSNTLLQLGVQLSSSSSFLLRLVKYLSELISHFLYYRFN